LRLRRSEGRTTRRVRERTPPPPYDPPEDDAGANNVLTIERVVRVLFITGTIAAAGWLLWYFAGLFVYLIVGGILAYFLRPLCDRLQGVGLRRVPAIGVSFTVFVGVVGALLTFLAPFVATQVNDLSQLASVESVTGAASYIEGRLQAVVPLDEGAIEQNVREAMRSLREGDLMGRAQVAETVSSVVSVFTNIFYAVIIIPFITFFFLKDGPQMRRSALRLVPNRYFEVTLAILDKVETNIGRYFRALVLQCLSIAAVAAVLLSIVGLDEAITIGIFTGLANTIPYFGPFLGFVAGALVSIAQTGDFSLVPGVLLAMALTQMADNVFFQPLIFSKAAQAHPLVILFVVLIGAQLGGIVGMLIAIPLATTVRVIVGQVVWSLRNYQTLRAQS